MDYIELFSNIFFFIYVTATITLLIFHNKNASTIIAWIFLFIFLPVISHVAYLIIGVNWKKRPRKKTRNRQEKQDEKFKTLMTSLITKQPENENILENYDFAAIKKIYNLTNNTTNTLLTTDNTMTLFHTGTEKFDMLMKDIENAQKFIHMEYFIWTRDELTEKIKQILEKKARSGVEVRIVIDSIGSLWLRRKYINELKQSGVKIYSFFNAIKTFKFYTINFRNHRKTVIIDGKIAYSGGMNMSQDYIDGGKKFTGWHDIHARFTGNVVHVLHELFTSNWEKIKKENLYTRRYFPLTEKAHGTTSIQIVPSGPTSFWPAIHQLYTLLLSSAQKTIYIQSPYFIPDETILETIYIAALSGIDVRILLTEKTVQKIPAWAAFTYFEKLLHSGVKIYFYKNDYMHAKALTIDGKITTLGTANMDIRSFTLNYEMNSVIYDTTIAQNMQKAFLKDLKKSRQFTLEDYKKIPYSIRFRNAICRLLSPLL